MTNPRGKDGLTWTSLRRLAGDGIVRSILGLWFALALFVLFLVGTSPGAAKLALRFGPVVFLGLAVISIRPQKAKTSAERLFWYRILAALLLWLAAKALYFTQTEVPVLWIPVACDALFAGFYIALILAVEDRADRSESAQLSLQRGVPIWPAVTLFVLGLLGYWVIMPARVYDIHYLDSSSSLWFYVALDLYLIVRVAICRVDVSGDRWRGLYAALWVLSWTLLVSDGLELLISIGWLRWRLGLAGEVLWLLPMVVVVMMARWAALAPVVEEPITANRLRSRLFPREHLIAFAIILPALHLTGYCFNLFDPQIQGLRGALVLVWLVALGSLAIVQYHRVVQQREAFARTLTEQASALARQEERLTQLSERREIEEALRLSEEKFSKAFRASPDPMLLTSVKDGTYVDVNLGFEEVTGWSRSEVLGRSTLDPSVWPSAEDRQHFVDRMREEGRVRGFEGRIITKGGEFRRVEISAEPIEIDRVPCILSVVRDVTKARQLEEQALRTQRMNSVGTLAGGLAHDLNNLLTPILMSIQLLQRESTEEGDLRLLATLETNAERAAGVVRQLLTFARGRGGERRRVDLSVVLSEVEAIARETFPRTLKLTFAAPSDLWAVEGDATLLHQVLLNLCLNARDATKADGQLTVTVRNERVGEETGGSSVPRDLAPGSYVVMRVADDGVGIDEELRDRIFEPFYTSKGAGEGTGLGLPTVAAIVRSHGGIVDLETSPGRGAVFSCWIPADEDSVADSSQDHIVGVRPGGGELILLVDDEASIREVATQILDRHGYQVEVAADGAEGLSRFVERRKEVRLVLIDMMMPLLDGPSTVTAIRRMDTAVPILGMSGWVSEGNSDVRDRLQGFLNKPFTAQALLMAVGRALAE
ncbi:MAG: PAS domain S-box protein [Thermoanaerobaculia bacterium]|nr:PAS domain S-box protein [Thermoanaerobaculia bacterium]